MDEKNIFDRRESKESPGSRMKNINNSHSQFSMMRLAETPPEEQKRRKKGKKNQEKEEITNVPQKKKSKKVVR